MAAVLGQLQVFENGDSDAIEFLGSKIETGNSGVQLHSIRALGKIAEKGNTRALEVLVRFSQAQKVFVNSEK